MPFLELACRDPKHPIELSPLLDFLYFICTFLSSLGIYCTIVCECCGKTVQTYTSLKTIVNFFKLFDNQNVNVIVLERHLF